MYNVGTEANTPMATNPTNPTNPPLHFTMLSEFPPEDS
jgi:hypothetical protein